MWYDLCDQYGIYLVSEANQEGHGFGYNPNEAISRTKLFAQQLRSRDGKLTGDGGAGDSRYGSTSAAFDQLGWGTLLFYQGE